MKIEPVALFLHDEYAGYIQMGEWDEQMGGLLDLSKEEWYADAVPLYTEAQLRQLGEACAAVCDDDVTVERIRELVKEMLG